MNILLINHYAGSLRHGMEYRPYYLAREWVRAGHRVCIVASAQSHIRSLPPKLNGQSRLDETIDGIDYVWLQTPPYDGNGIGRARNMISFIASLYRETKSLIARCQPDVVIASSTYPLDIWPAHRMAKLARAKLFFEVHDLWPLSPMELGKMSKWHPFIMLLQAAEDYACRHADGVISILPKVREYLESRGMASHKLHIVPNGIDPTEWLAGQPALQPGVKNMLEALRSEGKFIVGYAGTHGLANALDVLLATATLMQQQKITFVLVGGGPEKIRLQQLALAANLHNICFIDPVKKEQIPALLKYFDIAYLGWQHKALYRFGIAPNKLMDYMMAGKPVLHAVDAGNDPVQEANCGLSIAPEDPHAMAQAILTLDAMGEQGRLAMGQRGRAFVLNNLSYGVLGQRYLSACQAPGMSTGQ